MPKRNAITPAKKEILGKRPMRNDANAFGAIAALYIALCRFTTRFVFHLLMSSSPVRHMENRRRAAGDMMLDAATFHFRVMRMLALAHTTLCHDRYSHHSADIFEALSIASANIQSTATPDIHDRQRASQTVASPPR